MNTNKLISNYQKYLSEIKMFVQPELYDILDELLKIDPTTIFNNQIEKYSPVELRGHIWLLLMNRCTNGSFSIDDWGPYKN